MGVDDYHVSVDDYDKKVDDFRKGIESHWKCYDCGLPFEKELSGGVTIFGPGDYHLHCPYCKSHNTMPLERKHRQEAVNVLKEIKLAMLKDAANKWYRGEISDRRMAEIAAGIINEIEGMREETVNVQGS